MKPQAPPHVRALIPYVPGKPEEELQRELGVKALAKLASNENSLGPSPKAIEAIVEYAGHVHRYPDGGSYLLRQALAQRYGFSMEEIVVGNGSNELLELVARAYLTPEDSAVAAEYAFAVYEAVVRAIGAELIVVPLKRFTHDLDAMAKSVKPTTKVVFVANPNNPTGTMVGRAEVERFLHAVPEDVVVVLDEAYCEYIERPDVPRSMDYVRERKNVIVLRTFSKVYGLAGLRIGFGIAPAEMISDINRVREPFNVNLLAQVAARAALDDDEHVRRSVELNRAGKAYLYEQLDEMGVPYVPSETNFLLVNVRDGQKVYEKLLWKGVIVRPMTGYRLPEYIRVSIGLPEENEAFINSLRQVLSEDTAGRA